MKAEISVGYIFLLTKIVSRENGMKSHQAMESGRATNINIELMLLIDFNIDR